MRWVYMAWAQWLMKLQAVLLKRIAIAEQAEAECEDARIVQRSPYLAREWFATARQWKVKRERHKQQFMRLQRTIDSCLSKLHSTRSRHHPQTKRNTRHRGLRVRS
jgi:hypothetical protein